MLCIKPFRKPSAEFGCGQCLSCRINRRRTWAARIVLESMAYRESSFVTLTYNPDHLPEFNSLSKAHWREFTKGIGFRYFGCGEYGNKTNRPHYHLILFGIDAARAQELALQRWPYGFVSCLPFVLEHAAYVAGYTVKKLTSEDDPRLDDGQIPEFALMSRRPGIGVRGVDPFVRWFRTPPGQAVIAQDRDVPSSIRIAGSHYPIGRTLRRRMRDELSIPHDDPVRTMRRENLHRVRSSIPEIVASTESKRVSRYEFAKRRAGRPSGTL